VRRLVLALVLSSLSSAALAQQADDQRAQYPAWLADSYFSVGAGAIFTPFSQRQLEPGVHAETIGQPRLAARVALFGHELTPHIAVQFAYARPAFWAVYRNVNGDGAAHHVWTSFGSATFVGRAPIGRRWSVFGEAGLAIASRHGFDLHGVPAVRDASYATVLAGAGVDYHLTAGWDATAEVAYMPANAGANEPRSVIVDGGFRYTMRPLSEARVRAARDSEYTFYKRLVQFDVTMPAGYAIDSFFSNRIPIFWVGQVDVHRGAAVHVDRNVFHTASVFALDVGTSASVFQTRGTSRTFYTLSVYPRLRVFLLRTPRADVSLSYAAAGPTFMSTRALDGHDLGSRFTFQDFMGAGVFLGPAKRLELGVKINHYSNGNLFPENAGVTVPVTLTLGWAF